MFLFIDNIVFSQTTQTFIIQFDILILCNNTEHLKNINKLCDMNLKIWNSTSYRIRIGIFFYFREK